MIGHEEARTYTSARADGELDAAFDEELDTHLASCGECLAFARGVRDLSALASALPREHAPASLVERVLREILSVGRRARDARSRRLVVAPAFAMVVVIAVTLALVLRPAPRFLLPGARAATALSRITSMVMEREIREFDEDGSTRTLTTERIWFRAPASTRIERETQTFGPAVTRTSRSVEIRLPGVRYVKTDAVDYVETNLPPSATTIAEPLSPALVFFGERKGPGPTIAGRPTIAIALDTPGARRVAYVDAERFTLVGDEQSVVLGKETFPHTTPRVRKTARSVQYNVPVEASLFRIPATTQRIEYGFRTTSLGDLSPAPRATPRGFAVVRAGAGPEGQAALLSRGAFSILVEIRAAAQRARVDELMRVARVDGRPATIVVGVYSLPRISFEVDGRFVTISAALPEEALIALANELY